MADERGGVARLRGGLVQAGQQGKGAGVRHRPLTGGLYPDERQLLGAAERPERGGICRRFAALAIRDKMSSLQKADIDRLYKKGLFLEYVTVGYNVGEAIVSIGFGSLAGSIALIGFGLDSIIESLSGLVLVWRLKQRGKVSEADEERIEKRTVKLVAISFFLLGAYVLGGS